MPRKRCLVKSCKPETGGFIFHIPESHVVGHEVRKKWLEVIEDGRINLLKKPENRNIIYGICHMHFTSESFLPASLNKDKMGRPLKKLALLPNAIPTVNVEPSANFSLDMDPLASEEYYEPIIEVLEKPQINIGSENLKKSR